MLCQDRRSLQKGQYLYFTMRNNLQSEKTSEKRILSFLLHSQYEQQGTCRGRAFCDRTEQAVHSGRTSAQTECGGVSDYKYENGTLIYLTYNLSSEKIQKTYNLVGKILSVKELENRRGTFEHRVQYINIDNQQREEIIRYIFEEERKNRQRKNG